MVRIKSGELDRTGVYVINKMNKVRFFEEMFFWFFCEIVLAGNDKITETAARRLLVPSGAAEAGAA